MHLTLLALVAICGADAAEDLKCLKPQAGEPAPSTLFYSALQQQAYATLDRRKSAYEELKTPDQIATYQRRLRDLFVEQLGGFPERCPLNAQVVGKLAGDGFTIAPLAREDLVDQHVRRFDTNAKDTGNQADHRVRAFLLRRRSHRELAQAFLFDRADLVAYEA